MIFCHVSDKNCDMLCMELVSDVQVLCGGSQRNTRKSTNDKEYSKVGFVDTIKIFYPAKDFLWLK